MPFKRPEHLEYPKTYHSFSVKSKTTNEVTEFRVQDLPEERFEEALEMLRTHFLPDESLCSAKGIDVDEASIKIISDIWIEMMRQKFSIACFRNDGCDDLIAVNVLTTQKKDDPKEITDYRDDKVKDVFDAMDYTVKHSDIYGKYNVDEYLTAYGLCVNRAYRGMGIATEMLKARAPFLKVMGLKVTGTAFTGIGSQIAAKKAGYEDYFTISYEEFKKVDLRFDFINNSTKTKEFKMMALKAEQ